MKFAVQATDGERLVYRGSHTRAIIDRARFLARIGISDDVAEAARS